MEATVSDIYEQDYQSRFPDIIAELLAEIPGDILSVDWTKGTAKRCSGAWMFNAMDSNGKIIAAILTNSTGPREVEPVMRELRARN